MLMKLVVLCALVGLTIAATSQGPPDAKPEKFKHLEGCYIEEIDEVIPYGTSRPSPKVCAEFSCSKYWVESMSCGATMAMPPYVLVEDREKPYPDCCPRAELPKPKTSD